MLADVILTNNDNHLNAHTTTTSFLSNNNTLLSESELNTINEYLLNNDDHIMCENFFSNTISSSSLENKVKIYGYLPNELNHKIYCISSKGRKGLDGKNGKSGIDGRFGANGKTGLFISEIKREMKSQNRLNGHNGEDGTCGEDGKDGSDGEDATDLHIKLFTKEDNLLYLIINNTIHHEIKIDKDFILLLDARGGNGGNGGNGGHGGNGGNGGSGANSNSSSGGNGGNGGTGGDAGRGGNGGNCGKGGNIFIETSQPELLMLIETITNSGKPGKAGLNGRFGIGGFGGNAGVYIPINSLTVNQFRNEQFKSGKHGMPGKNGKEAKSSQNGKSNQNGKVTYHIINNENEIIESSNEKFNIKVLNFDIIPKIDDGILSPGELCYITNIEIENTGGLTLNEGKAALLFPNLNILNNNNNDNNNSKNTEILIPTLKPKEKIKLSQQFEFKISNHLRKKQNELICKVKLMEKYFINIFKKQLYYDLPIQFLNFKKPSNLVRKEITTISFQVKNKSNLTFDNNKTRCAKLKIKMLDKDLKIIPSSNLENLLQKKLQKGSDEEEVECPLDLDLNEIQTISFDLQVQPKANFFTKKFWKLELYLSYGYNKKEKEFEYISIKEELLEEEEEQIHNNLKQDHNNESSLKKREKKKKKKVIKEDKQQEEKEEEKENGLFSIQILPNFIPITNENEFDLLFVIYPGMPRKEFQRYQEIFDGLELNCNYWDIEKNNGFSYYSQPSKRSSLKDVMVEEEEKQQEKQIVGDDLIVIKEDFYKEEEKDDKKEKRHVNTWVDKFNGKCIVFPFLSDSLQQMSGKSKKNSNKNKLMRNNNDTILLQEEEDLILEEQEEEELNKQKFKEQDQHEEEKKHKKVLSRTESTTSSTTQQLLNSHEYIKEYLICGNSSINNNTFHLHTNSISSNASNNSSHNLAITDWNLDSTEIYNLIDTHHSITNKSNNNIKNNNHNNSRTSLTSIEETSRYLEKQQHLCEELFRYIDPKDFLRHLKDIDSSFILINGPEPSSIVNYLVSKSEPIEIDSNYLSQITVFSVPSPEDFVKKCKEYVEKKEEQQPSKHFILNDVIYNTERKGIVIGKTLLGRASYVTLSPLSSVSRFYVTPNIGLLMDENIDLSKTITFYTNSKFFIIFYTIFSSLSISLKLKILKQSHQNKTRKNNFHAMHWRFRFHQDERQEFNLIDILNNSLYIDIKQELFYKDLNLERLNKIITTITHDLLGFGFKDAIYILWNIICKLEKYVKNNPFRQLDIVKMKKSLQKVLFEGKLDQYVNYLFEIKNQAEMDVEDINLIRWFTSLYYSNVCIV
ncbi:hypothetical protein ABK040_014281 [Willaertia magna]